MKRKVEIAGMGTSLQLFLSVLLFLIVGLVGPDPAQAQNIPPKFKQAIQFPSEFNQANITIVAKDADIQVISTGQVPPKTRMWTLGGEFPPPTIRRPTGNQTRVTFVHNLTEINTVLPDHNELTIHHHGAHVAPVNDGWACGFFIRPGENRTYVYDLKESDAANPTGNERGVTQWYHNHRVDVTRQTIWAGLGGGIFIIDDPADPQTLPSGKYDRTLAITDRTFDANNQILPYTNGVGNVILVNGRPWPRMSVDTHKYRFRVLNPSNNRRYGMQLVDGSGQVVPLIQIASDSGLLPAPVSKNVITIGIAERLEFVIDFNGRLGQTLTLKNTLAAGDLGDIMQFEVTTQKDDTSVVPAILRAIPGTTPTPDVLRSFLFDRTTFNANPASNPPPNGTLFTINGQAMDCNRTDASLKLNSTEQWTLANAGAWVHSIHIHDVDQRCVSRNGGPCDAAEGMKETWPMLARETIVVQLTPTDFTQSSLADGRYMLHCHVLEHEDLAMMTQWEVIP